MTPIIKACINSSICIATEACTQKETHVFIRQDDNYFPAIADDADKYFTSHRREIIESALNCPVGAISLQFANGKVITAYECDEQQWVDY